MARIGVDVGGTFTDLLLTLPEAGRVLVHKVPTTQSDPSIGTVQGIRELCDRAGIEPTDIDQVMHGTTTATNIVLEHDGARVGMVTTQGYRDILHIARHKRPLNFSHYQDLPWQKYPLVRRRFRRTVPERILADGEVLVPLDEDLAREAVRSLREDGCEAIAVCFLFSFLDPSHERRVKEIVEEEFPEAFLSVSSDVVSQFREYERFSTTALNAYVGPRVVRYIKRLDESLLEIGVRTGVHLMSSGSGVVTSQAAIERPVNLVMSGPVGGVIGGIWAGRQAGYENVITIDVGGTSADVGLAESGEMRMKHLLDTKAGDYQAMIPMVDVDTVGAGGGSIVYVDAGGMFRVGPRSAGAEPGPACYQRGGTEPAVTDAMLVLGRLDPANFLGGDMTLSETLAREAIATVGEPLDMEVEEAAHGAIQILVHSLVQAIEQTSVRKGFDPRDFVLVAEGGAGPMFAAEVGREVGTPKVLIPPHPGIAAAIGLLATDLVYEYAATHYQDVSRLDHGRLESAYGELEAQALAQLHDDGIADDRIRVQRLADCRYEGQGYELRVAVPDGSIDEDWAERTKDAFHAAHERAFARRDEEADVQIINLRVQGVGRMPELEIPGVAAGSQEPDEAALSGHRDAWFEVDGKLEQLSVPLYERGELKAGNRVAGPAIVNQFDTTTIVPSGMHADVDAHGNLIIDCASAPDDVARTRDRATA